MSDTANSGVSQIKVSTLCDMKRRGEKFACLTAYDASFAAVLDEAGVELVLVGDSLGMVIQGHETTLPVTMDDMVYHTANVARACKRPLLMADLPFMSYTRPEQALENAARLMQEGGAHAVKLEGGYEQAETVRQLARCGIPVCAHLGLRPQSVHKLGGYRVQGRDSQTAQEMRRDAQALQEAGADMLLLECVPAALASEISASVGIPVIGIGAGSGCDAQILVLQDVLGITPGRPPRFSRNFMQGADSIQQAVRNYVQAVKRGDFPLAEHTFN